MRFSETQRAPEIHATPGSSLEELAAYDLRGRISADKHASAPIPHAEAVPANEIIWSSYYMNFVGAVARRCKLDVRNFTEPMLFADCMSESDSSSVRS